MKKTKNLSDIRRLDDFGIFSDPNIDSKVKSDSKVVSANVGCHDKMAIEPLSTKPTGYGYRMAKYDIRKLTKPRLCLNCDYAFEIKKSKVKRRRCPNCWSSKVKPISWKKYDELEFRPRIDYTTSKDAKTTYRTFWKFHDKDSLKELFTMAKKAKLRKEEFITYLIDNQNKTDKESIAIANYFYQSKPLRSILRK